MFGRGFRKRLRAVLAFLLIFCFISSGMPIQAEEANVTLAQEESEEEIQFRPDRINIKLKNPPSSGGDFSAFDSESELGEYGVLDIEPMFPEIDSGGLSMFGMTPEEEEMSKWYRAKLEEGQDPVEAAAALEDNPDVLAAEPDYLRSLSGYAVPDETTDPRLSEQWHLEKAGVTQAWDYLNEQGMEPGGKRDVVVAVIDTGVDYTHPDLQGNMWVNSAETASGGDSDGNGYADDMYGADVITGSGNPQDDHGHGTHVAGIIAAMANNSEGGAGVAFNVQIMAIKAAQSSGVLASSDIAKAIYYAVDKGADVINMSFGGYGRSVLEEDALQVAFGTSVLVASAGNSGIPNESVEMIPGKPTYPAAYNWVLGVMAQRPSPDAKGDNLAGFSNWDPYSQNSFEYELMAPGVEILSPLPNGQYAKWSGTSMAAPMVSGAAALLRSHFEDKNTYSSRFIMGQLASTGDMLQGKTYSNSKPPAFYRSLNVYKALTETPAPEVTHLNQYIFDSKETYSENNENGMIDAGETVDLALEVRNNWGKADDVQVKIDALSPAGIPDPYVEFVNDTVDYGSVGNFAVKDNGFIYDGDEITGVSNPFKIKVAEDTPNDHMVNINVTITAKNGLDASDETVYESESGFSLTVRKGRDFPRVISEDMTITKDDYWIISEPTLIEKGVTVTVEPGTKIQFYSSDPQDPYADTKIPYLQVEGTLIAEGTAQEPIDIFPSMHYSGHQIVISSKKSIDRTRPDMGIYNWGFSDDISGSASLKYVNLVNPRIAVDEIEHCNFTQDMFDKAYIRYLEGGALRTLNFYGPVVKSNVISNSRFYQLGYKESDTNLSGLLKVWGETENNIFDSCTMWLSNEKAHGNVYLKNHKLYESQWGDRSLWSSRAEDWGYAVKTEEALQTVFPVKNEANGITYVTVCDNMNLAAHYERIKLVDEFAQTMGGHIATIGDSAENEFVRSYYYNNVMNRTLFEEKYPGLDPGEFSYDPTIGFNDFEEYNDFTWLSGEENIYTNWSVGQPNKSNSFSGSTTLNSWDGKWAYNTGVQTCVIEIPNSAEVIDDAYLASKREQFLNEGLSTVTGNAILNVWNIPGIDHWMRFFSREGRDYTQHLAGNYWGTASPSLVEKAIVDYGDDFNRAKVLYEPLLGEAPVDAYPFVKDVYVSTDLEERASKLGAEAATVNVAFNRDMDTSVQPQVSFGPDMPYTDFMIDGDWVDGRNWQGAMQITPLTGDGEQFFRVAGAVAADDPWLVTGNDSERFSFEVSTSGTEAMNLQAVGEEGQVSLSWTQDDFELLAGYNIYRSGTIDGTYSKINDNIVPSEQKTFVDDNVEPGKTYFYKFTVVQTDFSESDFSNAAAATPLDTVAPVISHTPVKGAAPGMPLQIYADVTDNVRVEKAELFYRIAGSGSYSKKEMVKTTGDRYAATIEGLQVQAPGIDYYIQATDGVSIVRNGRADSPNQVAITDAPKVTSVTPSQGPSSGGTSVVIMGTNFKAGASVTFGQAAASNVVVESENRITALVPAHYPAVVDVKVTNPDSYSDTLLRGFTYKNEGSEVSLSDIQAHPGQMVELPIAVDAVEGLLAGSIKLSFDKDVLSVESVRKGSLTSGFSLEHNKDNPGELQLSLASATAVKGSGTLAVIEFRVLESEKGYSAITLEDVSLNDGSIAANKVNGSFTAANTSVMSGNILYYNGNGPVGGASLKLSGEKTYSSSSGENGSYSISGIEAGPYTLTASKSDEVTGISAYDASLILQGDAGILSLSGNQKTAGDVNRSGAANSMDASYVLQRAVGLIQVPFPGAGKVWAFEPGERSYANVAADVTGQNFTAILLGDVSGSWNMEGSGIQSMSTAEVIVKEPLEGTAGAVAVPLNIDPKGESIYAVDITVTYDESKANFEGVEKGSSAESFIIAVNDEQPGIVKIAMASSEPIVESGELIRLLFEKTGAEDFDFSLDQADVNEEAALVSYEEKDDGSWKSWEEQSTSDASKTWTVEFSKEVDGASVGSGTVYVTDESGKKIQTSYQLEGKELKITPSQEYTVGKSYTLWIKDLRAKDGASLSGNVKMKFTITQ